MRLPLRSKELRYLKILFNFDEKSGGKPPFLT
jgi:hypothetical protein